MINSGDICDYTWETKPTSWQSGLTLHFDKWKTEFLVDYIVNIHHAYLHMALSQAQQLLVSMASDKNDPVLENINRILIELSELLSTQTRQEENIIFPYIKQIDAAFRRKEPYGNLFVRTLRKQIFNTENDHKGIDNLLIILKDNTGNYTTPLNAPAKYHELFDRLKAISKDLTNHRYLEAAILFPRAKWIEKELLQL